MGNEHGDQEKSSSRWDPTTVYGACVFTGILGLVGTLAWAVFGVLSQPLALVASPISLLAAAAAFGLLANATRRG